MIELGDYIGQLVSELTIARVQADLEAIRVAELFANHELLKHFPIPRMRLKDVEIDIPLVILEAKGTPAGTSPRGTVSTNVMKTVFKKITKEIFEQHGIKLSSAEVAAQNKAMDLVLKKYSSPRFVKVDSNLVADKLAGEVRSLLRKKKVDADQIDKIAKSVRKEVRTEFVDRHTLPPRIRVGVTSKEIREATSESLVRISVKVTEEGVEWHHVYPEENGDEENIKSSLIPE